MMSEGKKEWTKQEAENIEFLSDLLNGDLTKKLYKWVEETEEEFIFHTLLPWSCDEEQRIVNKDWLRKAMVLYGKIEKAKTNLEVLDALFDIRGEVVQNSEFKAVQNGLIDHIMIPVCGEKEGVRRLGYVTIQSFWCNAPFKGGEEK